MRKIKFRRIDSTTGEKICSDSIKFDNDSKGRTFCWLRDEFYNWIVVESNSVSEFIGAYDCDGTEVYEGDIVEYEGKHKFIVKWDDDEIAFAMFRLDGKKSPVQFHGEAYKKLKVVGNIFDNAEWLNQGDVN